MTKEEQDKIQKENNEMVKNFLKKGLEDLNLIITGLRWLSENIDWREAEMNKSDGLSSKYAIRQNRVLSRVKDFVKTQEDGLVILYRTLLELPIHQDVLDITTVAMTIQEDGKCKPIEDYGFYERLLLCKLVFGKETHYA